MGLTDQLDRLAPVSGAGQPCALSEQKAEPILIPPLFIGFIGTVLSVWFLIDWLRASFDAIARADSTARFQLINPDDLVAILARFQPPLAWSDRLRMKRTLMP
jgi:hypothetical protein